MFSPLQSACQLHTSPATYTYLKSSAQPGMDLFPCQTDKQNTHVISPPVRLQSLNDISPPSTAPCNAFFFFKRVFVCFFEMHLNFGELYLATILKNCYKRSFCTYVGTYVS